MSGIDVDDDEADSDFDQHRNIILKNNDKLSSGNKQNNNSNNPLTDVRIRASSGSNNILQQRSGESQ